MENLIKQVVENSFSQQELHEHIKLLLEINRLKILQEQYDKFDEEYSEVIGDLSSFEGGEIDYNRDDEFEEFYLKSDVDFILKKIDNKPNLINQIYSHELLLENKLKEAKREFERDLFDAFWGDNQDEDEI